MKIVIDARFYGLENTGLGRYTLNLVNELKKMDHDNEYVILLRKKYFKELILPDNWRKILFDVHHYSILEQLKLPFIVYKEKPDIFHTLQINFPVLYFGKSIVTVHDITQLSKKYDATTLPKPIYLIKLLVLKLIFNLKVKHATKIIVPSNKVKNDLTKRGFKENKITVIYEGVDKFFFRKKKISSKPLDTRYFIYVGNAYPHKNIKRAIDAICMLNDSGNEKVSLKLISARNNFTNEISNYIDSKSARNLVEQIGYVSDDELVKLLKRSVAFIYPSLTEGFGLQGLEAMASGTPLIASDIPVFKEIYDDVTIFFNPTSVSSIKEAMKYILGLSDKERKLLIKKGKHHASGFTWTKMGKNTLLIYEESNIRK